MTPAFAKYDKMTDRDWLGNRIAKVTKTIDNEYYADKLPRIPCGTLIRCDFAGDFGMYAMADINGTLSKVKVRLEDFEHISFDF